mgnify:CR=1 FL=1
MKSEKKSWMNALFAYAEGEKNRLILSVVLSVLSVMLWLVPFYCMYRLICLMAAGTATAALAVKWCLLALAAYAAKVVLFGLSTGTSHAMAYTILEGLRLRLADRFLHAPLGNVENHTIGEIKTMMVDKIETLEPPLAHMIPEGAGHVVLPVVSIIALLCVDWRLALASLVTFPLSFLCMGLTFKISGKNFDKYDQSASYMNSTIVEYIEGIEVIKAFGRAGVSYEKYASAITDFRTFVVKWLASTFATMKLSFALFPSTLIGTLPAALAAYTVGLLIEARRGGTAFDTSWGWKCIVIQVILVFFRFLFDYLRARLQEPISYQLTARDRLAVGDALKRVSLGYFQQVSTGNILSSITTGLSTLENMGIRMIDNFVGGYLNFLVIFVCLAVCSPVTALIALAAAALSLCFLLVISHYSRINAPVEAHTNRDMTGAVIEYARGLAVVKSFGKSGASMDSVTQAIGDSKRIHLKIEWGYIPGNVLHLLALKCGSVGLALAAALQCLRGEMDFSLMLMFVFFSFSIFASLEPISDNAHTLGVIDDAMDQLDALRSENFIDADGKDIPLEHYDIAFDHVGFGYDSRQVLKDVSFTIPEKTSTAIVGPSGGGKTTLCHLLSRFWDVDGGHVTLGGHDVREYDMDSLMENFSFVFQNVYLFHDTVANNIRFGQPDAPMENVIERRRRPAVMTSSRSCRKGMKRSLGKGEAPSPAVSASGFPSPAL